MKERQEWTKHFCLCFKLSACLQSSRINPMGKLGMCPGAKHDGALHDGRKTFSIYFGLHRSRLQHKAWLVLLTLILSNQNEIKVVSRKNKSHEWLQEKEKKQVTQNISAAGRVWCLGRTAYHSIGRVRQWQSSDPSELLKGQTYWNIVCNSQTHHFFFSLCHSLWVLSLAK